MTTPDGIRHWDKFNGLTVAYGYSDVGLNIKLQVPENKPWPREIQINLQPADVQNLLDELQRVQRYARSFGTL